MQVSEVRMRSVFIHVDVPGQEDDAAELETFPTIQQIGKLIFKNMAKKFIPALFK